MVEGYEIVYSAAEVLDFLPGSRGGVVVETTTHVDAYGPRELQRWYLREAS